MIQIKINPKAFELVEKTKKLISDSPDHCLDDSSKMIVVNYLSVMVPHSPIDLSYYVHQYIGGYSLGQRTSELDIAMSLISEAF